MTRILIVVMLLGSAALADAPATQPARTGSYGLTLEKRSKLSAITELCRRAQIQMQQLERTNYEKDYDIAKESFAVIVPDSYKPNDGWGVLVWVSPGEKGGLFDPRWKDLLSQRKLIWIGPNNVGNPRAWWCRAALAVDAAEAIKARYAIDTTRIYISGFSGGGRVSSMAGVLYPDLFTGGIYMDGCNFYRDMPETEGAKQVWRKSYGPPEPRLFNLAKKNSRHVLLTSEKDMNRAQTRANYERGFVKDGFERVLYLEVPEIGHTPPPVAWVEKAIDFLDKRDKAK